MGSEMCIRDRLSEYRSDQILMIENLLLLHDSHYGRLYQKLAVFLDLHLCGFLFNLLFCFQRNVYVDAVLFAVETKRKGKKRKDSINS